MPSLVIFGLWFVSLPSHWCFTMELQLNSSVKILTHGPRMPSVSVWQLVLTSLDSAQDKANACPGLCLLGPKKAFLCRFSGAFMKVVLWISEVTSLSLNYPQTLPSSLEDSFLVLLSTSPVLPSTKSLLCMYCSCPVDPGQLTAHEFLK